jgi:hypothetical protein
VYYLFSVAPCGCAEVRLVIREPSISWQRRPWQARTDCRPRTVSLTPGNAAASSRATSCDSVVRRRTHSSTRVQTADGVCGAYLSATKSPPSSYRGPEAPLRGPARVLR